MAAAAIDDKQGVGLAVLDVGDLIGITDVFLIASGTSKRQVRTLVEEVETRLAAADRKPLHREGIEDAQWVLLDYGDVVVHIFQDEVRRFYELERLWADAPRVEAVSAEV